MTPGRSLLDEALRLHRAGAHARAAQLYQSVLRTDPRNYEALFHLGLLYGQNRHFEEAQHFTGEALKLKPSPGTFLMRGYALAQLGRHEEAVACFSQALALKPDYKEALLNRSSSLFRLRRYEEAAADYRQLLALDADFPFARGNLLFCRLHGCDWRDIETEREAIRTGLAAGKRVIAPFDAKAIGLTPEEELRCARIWVADQCPPAAPLWHGETYAHGRIRVAYLSADFHAHAAATLTAGLFEHHDRRQFETIALSLGPDDGSPMRKRLMRAFDHFLDMRGKSDVEIASLMRQMEVDIAIDMMGFTEGCRPGILAARPAPVQVNYLGFPGTMGADFIDYILADRIVIPKDRESAYAEKVVHLPHSFMPADAARPIGASAFPRAELGLPADGFVFCCFNASYKIVPPMFDVWMRLLGKIDGSVLWLSDTNEAAKRNLAREAGARGVAASRLIFAERIPRPEDHLARLKAADLFLDTLPYNAHATANDALWAGVPVLTCIGEGFAGRVAASQLEAIGLPGLSAHSLEEYEALAIALAHEPAALAAIRAKLAHNRATQPLFDTASYTHHLEAAYVAMIERRCGPPA